MHPKARLQMMLRQAQGEPEKTGDLFQKLEGCAEEAGMRPKRREGDARRPGVEVNYYVARIQLALRHKEAEEKHLRQRGAALKVSPTFRLLV